MTFLKKLGEIILKFTEIATGIGPLLSTAYPQSATAVTTVTSDLSQIAQIIAQVEAMGQALNIAGPQKLTAAAPLVAQIVLSSSLLVNQKIDDPVMFQKACTEIAGGVADLLNSLKANIDTTSKT